MDENFLLHTPLSQNLFHGCAKTLPIIDYHNHLSVEDLAADRRYQNLAQLWLLNDPYKHRAMRICGVEERLITGDAADFDKFKAWMSVLPGLIGNPLYDWSVLEMKRVFGIELKPGITDAAWLWEQTGSRLSGPEYSALDILSEFHVEYAAPCAAVTEDVSVFNRFGNIAPSLRGDSMVDVSREVIEKLEGLTQSSILTLEDYFRAVSMRLEAFSQAGCTFADHALDDGFAYMADDGKNRERFTALAQGNSLDCDGKKYLESEILRFLAGEYAGRGWTMQLHIGALRYTSSRLRRLAGPAGGFAGIGSGCNVGNLTKMLDAFEEGRQGMPRIILFTLNPADNAVMSALSGSYSQDGIAGKVQQGPAWWWCDHLYGMREVFEHISSFGVLSVFVGMTTDSRSILSFVRHEYFRRALCGWIGDKAEKGEFTASEEALRKLVEDICYTNVKKLIRCEGR